MSQVSPSAEGFRAALRRPSLTLAEIGWRWIVGATAAGLTAFALIEYLDSVPLTNVQRLLLRTRQPFLVAPVVRQILHGSLNRIVLAAVMASLALVGLWIVAASIGRIATVRDLLDHFTARANLANRLSSGVFAKHPLRALIYLNLLRAAVALATVCALVGAAIVAGFASPESAPEPVWTFILFLLLAGLVGCIWFALNWLLSLAGIFAVRDGEDSIGATAAAVSLCRHRTGSVFAVSAWTAIAHFAAFIAATAIATTSLGLIAAVSWRLIVAAIILVTLIYFALADWLYIARLAGYISILEMPNIPVTATPLPPSPSRSAPAVAVSNSIDHDEPILSDISQLAAET